MTELYYGVSLPTEYSSSSKVHSVSDPYSLNPDPDKNLNPDPRVFLTRPGIIIIFFKYAKLSKEVN